MRFWFNRAHLGLMAVILVFVSSMSVLGGRAYQRHREAQPTEQVAGRPPLDGHRVSLASASGK